MPVHFAAWQAHGTAHHCAVLSSDVSCCGCCRHQAKCRTTLLTYSVQLWRQRIHLLLQGVLLRVSSRTSEHVWQHALFPLPSLLQLVNLPAAMQQPAAICSWQAKSAILQVLLSTAQRTWAVSSLTSAEACACCRCSASSTAPEACSLRSNSAASS